MLQKLRQLSSYRFTICLAAWLLAAIAIIIVFRSHAFDFSFQDETDHVAAGYFVLSHHLRLYRDFITIHQPFPVIIGGFFALLCPTTTFFAFISRLRLMMTLFWFGCSLLLIYRFRQRGLIVSLVTGLLAPRYFGFFVLAESLAYPTVAYMSLVISEKLFPSQISRPRLARFPAWLDDLLWSLACGYLIFDLLPMAPFIILATLIYIWPVKFHSRDFWLKITFISTGFLSVCAFLLCFISPFDWWDATIMNYLQYWSTAPFDVVKFCTNELIYLLYPLYSGLQYFRDPLWILWSVLILIPFVITFRRDRTTFHRLLIFYFLASLLNNRVVGVNAVYYDGFHLLPFVVGLASWSVVSYTLSWGYLSPRVRLFTSLLLIIFFANLATWLLHPGDRQTNYEINILPEQSLANVINTLKLPGDTLLTAEEGHGYLNLLTDLPFADRQNFHLPWSWNSPILRQDFIDTFATHPPTFVYLLGTGGYGFPELLLQEILPAQYLEIRSPGDNYSGLYLHRDRYQSLDASQLSNFAATYYTFAASTSSSTMMITD